MASSSASLKRREQPISRDGDQLIVTPLGAGSEVGRSCVYMSFRGKNILVSFSPFCSNLANVFDFGVWGIFLVLIFGCVVQFDCGIHPAYSGMAALPYFDEIDPSSIDVLLITQYVSFFFLFWLIPIKKNRNFEVDL